MWDMLTSQEKAKLEGHTGPIRSLAISRDGSTIVSGGGNDLNGVVDNTIR